MTPEIRLPRQMTGSALFSNSRFREMTLMPPAVISGKMDSPSPTARPSMPKAMGMEGPVTSASMTPTRKPFLAMAEARETVTELLPTPPLPDITA